MIFKGPGSCACSNMIMPLREKLLEQQSSSVGDATAKKIKPDPKPKKDRTPKEFANKALQSFTSIYIYISASTYYPVVAPSTTSPRPPGEQRCPQGVDRS